MQFNMVLVMYCVDWELFTLLVVHQTAINNLKFKAYNGERSTLVILLEMHNIKCSDTCIDTEWEFHVSLEICI